MSFSFAFVPIVLVTMAAPLAAPATTPHYVCEHGPVTRTAFTSGPAPCCDGHFNCPQLLSTGIPRPHPETRT